MGLFAGILLSIVASLGGGAIIGGIYSFDKNMREKREQEKNRENFEKEAKEGLSDEKTLDLEKEHEIEKEYNIEKDLLPEKEKEDPIEKFDYFDRTQNTDNRQYIDNRQFNDNSQNTDNSHRIGTQVNNIYVNGYNKIDPASYGEENKNNQRKVDGNVARNKSTQSTKSNFQFSDNIVLDLCKFSKSDYSTLMSGDKKFNLDIKDNTKNKNLNIIIDDYKSINNQINFFSKNLVYDYGLSIYIHYLKERKNYYEDILYKNELYPKDKNIMNIINQTSSIINSMNVELGSIDQDSFVSKLNDISSNEEKYNNDFNKRYEKIKYLGQYFNKYISDKENGGINFINQELNNPAINRQYSVFGRIPLSIEHFGYYTSNKKNQELFRKVSKLYEQYDNLSGRKISPEVFNNHYILENHLNVLSNGKKVPNTINLQQRYGEILSISSKLENDLNNANTVEDLQKMIRKWDSLRNNLRSKINQLESINIGNSRMYAGTIYNYKVFEEVINTYFFDKANQIKDQQLVKTEPEKINTQVK